MTVHVERIPELFGLRLGEDDGFYARNFSLFALPFLTGYFVWKRGPGARMAAWLALPFAAAALFANAFPLTPESDTEALTALHLPIALWLVVGIAYAGGRWSEQGGRMDFVRFSGELSFTASAAAAARQKTTTTSRRAAGPAAGESSGAATSCFHRRSECSRANSRDRLDSLRSTPRIREAAE